MKRLLIIIILMISSSTFTVENLDTLNLESSTEEFINNSSFLEIFSKYEINKVEDSELIEELRDVIDRCMINCKD
ncbi:hypothetical protein [Halobacteriovorax sp. HLS]|uniref:hypothetical protein n=1 Tax=Halobacteriovorax sp. HLS TaxID=2234000 RepID=UPI000FDB793E|nr:hypothetical protein [Halobacteriovorax sp. HLS]